jgi:UDP-N-acetylmuramate dehydrogenase
VIVTLGDALVRGLPGRVRLEVPLAEYTTYRIGGPAAVFVEPRTIDDVVQALGLIRDEGAPWMVLGLGSNLLVADAGFPGVVVRIGRALGAIETEGTTWRVGAGLPTPLLARRTAAAGLEGVHRLVGVPGTVGGGVWMNAGAHGQEFRDVVRRVRVVRPDGVVDERDATTIPWRYRHAGLGPGVVVEAEVALRPADPQRLRAEIAAHFDWRKRGTPFTEPCCGSVFRNPGIGAGVGEVGSAPQPAPRTAGQLIDAAGLKGFRIGGAQVSTRHANYIVNVGGATAADVLRVIDEVRERVVRAFGVTLRLEVQVVGEGTRSSNDE